MFYQAYIVKTHFASGGGSNASIRVSPLPGQGVDPNMKVECSRKMRSDHPVGTLFKICGKLTNRDGGTSFLYCHFNEPYEIVTQEAASQLIRENFGG